MIKKKETDKYEYCNHHHELTENQEVVNIGGSEFIADTEMLPLLSELNSIGLKTTGHCYSGGHPFVRISTDNIFNIEIRMYKDMKEILIQWDQGESKPN